MKKMNYNKLWKLLIDRGINRSELKQISGVSTTSLAKMSKGENVQTDVLLKICVALNVDVTDIMETVEVKKPCGIN